MEKCSLVDRLEHTSESYIEVEQKGGGGEGSKPPFCLHPWSQLLGTAFECILGEKYPKNLLRTFQAESLRKQTSLFKETCI